jgi:hypothetical protein
MRWREMTANARRPRRCQKSVVETDPQIAIVATFVAILGGSVVNLVLPAIGRELGGGMVTTNGWWTPTC